MNITDAQYCTQAAQPSSNRPEAALPLVSVYIPTKNRLCLLKRAIESVFRQTYPNIELIVADDGSTDGSQEYLTSLADEGKLYAIFMPVSGGACAARNAAIESASGEFVTGLDDDDHLLAYRIEKFVSRWQQIVRSGSTEGVAGIFCAGIRVSKNEEIVVYRNAGRVTAKTLRYRNSIGNQVFAPRKHFLEAGLFDATLICWQDWDMWLRMCERHGDFIGDPEPSYIWDIAHEQGRISDQAGQRIRNGSKSFAEKHGYYSSDERAAIVVALAGYKTIRLSLQECVVLGTTGRSSLVLAHLIRRYFGDAAFVRLWKFYRMFKSVASRNGTSSVQ
ncbi:glycosyltransferase [Paraburkholderia sediminicola]|uniref:glycosyltransferase n=1 Tax=Paraburkholderia sediminicola TaxID=458836 RepID=UPI0038BA9BF9